MGLRAGTGYDRDGSIAEVITNVNMLTTVLSPVQNTLVGTRNSQRATIS